CCQSCGSCGRLIGLYAEACRCYRRSSLWRGSTGFCSEQCLPEKGDGARQIRAGAAGGWKKKAARKNFLNPPIPGAPPRETGTNPTMNTTSSTRWAALLSAVALALPLVPLSLRASSHMDAPLITLDHAANTTDVYAFVVVRNNQKFLDVGLMVYPHEEPGVGPNKYGFDANVLYQIFLADPVTGADRVAYQFQFTDSYKTQSTILQAYTGVVGANGDAAQNFTQTYTVSKVVGTTSTVLGSGIVPPNNEGNATPKYNKNDDGSQPAK